MASGKTLELLVPPATGQGTTERCGLWAWVPRVGVTSWHRAPETCAKVPGATRLLQTNTLPAGKIISPGKIQQRDGARGAGLAPGWGTGHRRGPGTARGHLFIFPLFSAALVLHVTAALGRLEQRRWELFKTSGPLLGRRGIERAGVFTARRCLSGGNGSLRLRLLRFMVAFPRK